LLSNSLVVPLLTGVEKMVFFKPTVKKKDDPDGYIKAGLFSREIRISLPRSWRLRQRTACLLLLFEKQPPCVCCI
jgi:hypothetical protein